MLLEAEEGLKSDISTEGLKTNEKQNCKQWKQK